MNRRLRRLLIVAAVIGMVATLGWYLSRPKPIAVAVATADGGLVEATVANTRAGSVKACRRARLAPALGGQVAELLVHKGDHVTAGQILLRLWNDDLAAQVALSRSEAKAAEAQGEQACITADANKRDAQRIETLHGKGLASDDQLDRSRATAQSTAAACTAARAGAQVSRDRVRLNEALLARTVLTAPFDGIVAETTGEVGEFVTPSPPGIPTPPAVDLVDNSCLYVSAPIDEVDAPRVREQMPARILLDAFGSRAFHGHVRRIAPYVQEFEKQARTVEIEVQFDDPHEADNLLAGYSADAEVIIDSRPGVLRVPTEAILEGNKVLVFDNGTLHERTVGIGLANWQYTQVTSGLQAGDRVVTSVDREGVKDGVLATVETKAKP